MGGEPQGSQVNPHVRDRDNAVNSAIENGEGIRRLYIDPEKAPKTVSAIANLTVKGRSRSPLNDPTAALGYVIAWKDPIVKPQAKPAASIVTIGDPAKKRGLKGRSFR
jgi:hypothetical protein